jgi:hypothetical protein
VIWNAADGRTSLDEIVARLCDEFDVGPEAARHDAEAFLEEMAAHGIMHLNEQPIAPAEGGRQESK